MITALYLPRVNLVSNNNNIVRNIIIVSSFDHVVTVGRAAGLARGAVRVDRRGLPHETESYIWHIIVRGARQQPL